MRLTRRTVGPVPPRSAFSGYRFPREVIVLAVRWYLRFGLSYRDVEELLAERGIDEASKGSSPAKCFVSYNHARTLPIQPREPS
jgi:hypothetical protein